MSLENLMKRKHKFEQNNPKYYYCRYCDEHFHSYTTYIKHRVEIHHIEEKKVKKENTECCDIFKFTSCVVS